MAESNADGPAPTADTESSAPAPAPVPPVSVAKPEGKASEGGSIFSWIIILSLLGVWIAVGVVWFDIVDYNNVVGSMTQFDTDGDGHLDLEDAKVLLGLKERPLTKAVPPHTPLSDEFKGQHDSQDADTETESVSSTPPDTDSFNLDDFEGVASSSPSEREFTPFDPTETNFDSVKPRDDDVFTIDSTGELVVDTPPEEETSDLSDATVLYSEELIHHQTEEADPHESSKRAESATQRPEAVEPESGGEERKMPEAAPESSTPPISEPPHEQTHPDSTSEGSGKKKKPKMFNKFDKTIKADIDSAEKLRKKGKVEEALRAFEGLVQKYPQSPRSRYGKAQSEDDLAEKLRSNEMLLKAVNSYREAAELPDAPTALAKAALKRRADRQRFLGRMRGSLATLQLLVQTFPDDISLKNDLGVAHLLLGDNTAAKKVYEEVLAQAPNDGFAKVHYGFILKSENKIIESIPYLKEGLESEAEGTDDGRFYFHLGDALQRIGDQSAYEWYERGHKRGHFASVWQRSLYNVKGLRAQPWWTPKETGYTDLVKTLERNWVTIRDEALSVMNATNGLFVAEDENLREKGDWGQFTLWQQGRKVASSCRSVPKTCALMDRYPEATSCKRGQIKFSVMQPGTHVWPHTGPTNCRLRMHLGLVIPADGCRIRCTDQIRTWEEGKVLIFDDSFEHEVWQDANSYRLIFIVDVWHPELSQSQKQTLSPI